MNFLCRDISWEVDLIFPLFVTSNLDKEEFSICQHLNVPSPEQIPPAPFQDCPLIQMPGENSLSKTSLFELRTRHLALILTWKGSQAVLLAFIYIWAVGASGDEGAWPRPCGETVTEQRLELKIQITALDSGHFSFFIFAGTVRQMSAQETVNFQWEAPNVTLIPWRVYEQMENFVLSSFLQDYSRHILQRTASFILLKVKQPHQVPGELELLWQPWLRSLLQPRFTFSNKPWADAFMTGDLFIMSFARRHP